MGSLSLRAKIILLVLVALVGMAIISIFSITATKRDLTEGRKEVIKSLVEGGHNVLSYYHGLEKSGALTREEAQKQAAEAVGAAKYGGADGKTEYLYIWTNKGVGVMHVKRELIGQDMLEKIKDGQGTLHAQGHHGRRAGQHARRLCRYRISRPGGKEPLPKAAVRDALRAVGLGGRNRLYGRPRYRVP